jgi:YVTN family beta-propeller protein
VAVNPVNNKVYVANSVAGTVTVIDGATNGTTTVTADSESYAVAVNPVTNKVYVTNIAAGTVTVIDEVPLSDTKVSAEIDPLPGHATVLAQPELTGTAKNRLDTVHNVMMGVASRVGTSQQVLPWAEITSGAGTDSVTWSFSWGTDSLVSGENFICAVPFEMDAATTNNQGLGSSFAGNMVVYPLYRTWGLGLQEPSSSSSPFRPFGTTVLRGALVLPEASSREPQAASLLDISGRKVMELRPGANDVRALAPGIYFVRAVNLEQSAAGCHKVVVTR